MKGKIFLLIGGMVLLLSGSVFAAFNLSGTTKANAFCEILEITGSPVYTTVGGGVVNAKNYTDSSGSALSFKTDASGNLSYQYGENEETPKGAGTIGAKTLLVRAWDGGNNGSGNYAYSPSFGLGKSMNGVTPVSLSFSAYYQQAKPAAPVVSATQNGFNMSLQPLVTASLNIAGLANYEIVSLSGGKYNYLIKTGDAKNYDANNDSTSLALDPAKISAGTLYNIDVFARNGFGDGTAGTTAITTKALPSGALSFTLALESKVGATPAGAGINSFAMPFPSPWYAFKADGTTKLNSGAEIKTAFDLIKAINEAIGSNVVSSFGLWDKTNQKLNGVMLTGNDPGKIGDKSIGDSLIAITLKQSEGYQVYATKAVTLVIKNTP